MKTIIKKLLSMLGYGIHKSETINLLLHELSRLREQTGQTEQTEQMTELTIADLTQKVHMSKTDEDYDLDVKRDNIVQNIGRFGSVDFSEIACWLLASSLTNHKFIHQRLDEASLLWRTTKMTGGRILEIGRAGGGSTVAILGASGDREVVSLDRFPQHAEIADLIFDRDDVKNRLTLLTRSSRDEVNLGEFGMMFVDGDHTYEGVCHDIACFWNKLTPADGKPAMAVFHDAAKNPIAFVPEVAQACSELLKEKGVARVVESWGSMLLLEKVGDVEPLAWHTKENRDFWKQLSNDKKLIQIPPRAYNGTNNEQEPKVKVLENDYLGADNFDDPSWTLTGFTMEPATTMADSPLRVLRTDTTIEQHSLCKKIRLDNNANQFRLTTHLRPIGLQCVHIRLETDANAPKMFVDFRLDEKYEIVNQVSSPDLKISAVNLNYKNGYFCCEINLSRISNNLNYNLCIGSGTFSGGQNDNTSGEQLIILNAASMRGLVST